jgi:TfoX/Sxy family transcriptional regulator of competence genes
MSDQRFAALLAALAADPELAPSVADFEAGRRQPSRKFGANGLKVNGRIFAMLVRGNLVVKLPRQRADTLVASGQGEPFDPGHGRKMKEWVTILSPALSWVDLAREAHAFVAAVERPPSRASDTGTGSKLRVAKPVPAAGRRPPAGKK